MLSSGMTLSEAKSLIEVEREFCKFDNISEEETIKILKKRAKELGTSLAEVNSINVSGVIKDPAYQQPSYTEEIPQEQPSNNGGGSVVQQPSGNGNSNNSGGTTQKPSSNGDGAFDGAHLGGDGVGTSEESPDVTFEMP